MKLTDRIISDSNEMKKELDKKRSQYFYDDLRGTEMGMAYDAPPKMVDFNTQRSVYDTTDETSFNTAKSVFDKTAVFHTKKEER